MIIICPACRTQYAIAADALGVEGRTVRCCHCGRQWMQLPVEEKPTAPAFVAAAPVAAIQGPYVAAPSPAAPRQAPPLRRVPPRQPAPQPEPEPQPAPEIADEPVADPQILAEAIAEVITEPTEDTGQEPATEFEAESSEEQVAVRVDDDEEMDAATPPADEDADEHPGFDRGSLPAEEPIPEVFTSRDLIDDDDEISEEGGGRKVLMAVLVLLVLVAGLGAGLFFGRSAIVGMWAGAAPLYEMVGIDAGGVGAGLELLDVQNEWVGQGPDKQLVVTGTIANVSDSPRSVPMIQIEFRDAEGVIVQNYLYPPEVTELPPGERLNFRADVGDVVRTARRVDVTFIEDMPGDRGPK